VGLESSPHVTNQPHRCNSTLSVESWVVFIKAVVAGSIVEHDGIVFYSGGGLP